MNLSGLLTGAGVAVEIRSAVLPPIRLGGSGPAAPAGGEAPAPASGGGGGLGLPDPLRLVRPSVTVDAGGMRLVEWAPHGAPPDFPWVGVALVVVVVGGLFGAGYAVGRLTR